MAVESREHNKEEGKPRPRRTRNTLFGVIGAVAVLIALSAWGMHFTSQANFCANCHEIKPQVISWGTGAHKNIPCLDCHSNPGTVGYVSRKLKGLGEVYLHFTNQIPQKIEARFNVESCIVCHSGKRDDYPNAKNITLTSGPQAPKVSHQGILAGKVSCITCHKYVAHPYAEENQGNTAQ
jgi:cytochrome c nitrite reductase small subunit